MHARQPPPVIASAPPIVASIGTRALPALAGDTFLYAVSGGIGKGLSLLAVPYLSRALGATDYGLADLAVAAAGILALMTTFAGDVPVARLAARAQSRAERKELYGHYVAAVALFSTAVLVTLLPFAEWTAWMVWSSASATGLVIATLVLVPIGATQAALVTIQRLEGRPRSFAVLSTIDLIAQLTMGVVFVAMGLGAIGLVSGLIAGSIIGLIAAAIHGRGSVQIRLDLRTSAHLVRLGVPFLPSFIAFFAADFIVRAAIADGMGSSAVGAFGVAIRLASSLVLVSAAFQLAWGPHGLALHAGAASARVFGKAVLAYTWVAMCASAFLGAIGPEVVAIVSGPEFLPGAAALPGHAFGAAVAGTYFILLVGAGITGRSRFVAASSLLGAVTQVVLTMALLPALGLLAVTVGVVAGRVVSMASLTGAVHAAFDRRLALALAFVVVAGLSAIVLAWLAEDPHATALMRLAAACGFAAGGVAGVVLFVLHPRRKNPCAS